MRDATGAGWQSEGRGRIEWVRRSPSLFSSASRKRMGDAAKGALVCAMPRIKRTVSCQICCKRRLYCPVEKTSSERCEPVCIEFI